VRAIIIPATSKFFQEQEAIRNPRPAVVVEPVKLAPRKGASIMTTLRPDFADPAAVGKRFGRWTVIAAEGYCVADGRPLYTCRCDCGAEGMRRVSDLKAGRSGGCRSCAMKARNAHRGGVQ